MRNLNLLFNKEYYSKLDKDVFKDFENSIFAKDIESKNNDLANAEFDCAGDFKKSEIANQFFHLRTEYPGLLVGTGNLHGIGDKHEKDKDTRTKKDFKDSKQQKNNEVKMGFSFDYVTGQPYIPGSSVKGVLRSHFKNHPEAVAEILNSNGKYCVSKEDVGNLEKLIFDNSDVFLDAVVYDGSKNKKLIGFDYITPHKEVTQTPNPIKIIKVLPDVCFEFRFVLSDKEINGRIFPAGKLRCLFCELLCIFGAGAKTNVGYGNFVKEEERVKCPHCNTGNFRYTQKGAERKNCCKCGKPLK